MKKGDKFSNRSRRCVFVGYTYGKKGWVCMIWRNEISLFLVMLCSQKESFPLPIILFLTTMGCPMTRWFMRTLKNHLYMPVFRGVKEFVQSACEPNGDAGQLFCVSREDDLDEDQEEILGRGQRRTQAFVRLRDYITHTIQKMSPSTPSPPIPHHSSGTPYPITHYVNCEKFSMRHRNFIAALTTTREPV